MARPEFVVDIRGLSAVEQVISARGVEEIAGPEIEQLVVDTSKAFQAAVRSEAPVGSGRLSAWQRRSGKGHGTFRKGVSLSSKRAGFNTTARVRTMPIGNILRGGAKAHLIRPKNGRFLAVGSFGRQALFVRSVHHPGFGGNDYWRRATSTLEGRIEPLSRAAGFATADKMAERISRGA